jgi:uncharacterized membrane protein YfcA
MLNGFEFIIVGLAAVAGGAVNAVAGGGTLITFPVLIAVGVPAVAANVTNTIALSPGYFSATLTQRSDLAGQSRRLWLDLPIGILGGVAGAVLLLHTHEQVFRALVPYLILLASGLLALQERLRLWLLCRNEQVGEGTTHQRWSVFALFFAAIYGGYFGAGVSVIVLAILGISLEDSLTRLNALKHALAFSINLAAAIFFLFSKQVMWSTAAVMAVGAVLGGILGGKVAGRMKPAHLRRIVVAIGIVVAVVYWLR